MVIQRCNLLVRERVSLLETKRVLQCLLVLEGGYEDLSSRRDSRRRRIGFDELWRIGFRGIEWLLALDRVREEGIS